MKSPSRILLDLAREAMHQGAHEVVGFIRDYWERHDVDFGPVPDDLGEILADVDARIDEERARRRTVDE